jgi:hypothetical protein
LYRERTTETPLPGALAPAVCRAQVSLIGSTQFMLVLSFFNLSAFKLIWALKDVDVNIGINGGRMEFS